MNATMDKKPSSDRHTKHLIPLRVSDEMREVLRGHAERERRSLAQATALLLEEILIQKGLWPLPADQPAEAPPVEGAGQAKKAKGKKAKGKGER